jgi:hypothetical protein
MHQFADPYRFRRIGLRTVTSFGGLITNSRNRKWESFKASLVASRTLASRAV